MLISVYKIWRSMRIFHVFIMHIVANKWEKLKMHILPIAAVSIQLQVVKWQQCMSEPIVYIK